MKATGTRIVAFLFVWIVVSGPSLKDLPVGLATACLAAFVSLRLMPPGRPVRLVALFPIALDFLRESVVSGVDVAMRALRPQLDLAPGFVVCPLRIEEGPVRGAFLTVASLLPGTLPTGLDGSGGLVVHALDVKMPVAEGLAHEEALFLRTIGQ